MIGTLHALAPRIMLGGLGMIGGVSFLAQVAAASVPYVTTGEMHRFFFVAALSWTGAVVSGLAVVFAMVSKSRDSEMRAAIKANTEAVTALAEMFKEHHLDPFAHPAGSANRIDPVMEKLDGLAAGQGVISRKLERLYSEHRVIRQTELCMMNAANLAKRDPALSPYPHRSTDSEGTDFTVFRGAQQNARHDFGAEDSDDDERGAGGDQDGP